MGGQMLYPRAYDQQGRGTETSKEDCGPHQEETASPSHRAEAYIDDAQIQVAVMDAAEMPNPILPPPVI